jgi:hypothetical protein
MGMRRWSFPLAALAAALVVGVLPAAPAAAEPTRRIPIPVAAVAGLPSPRLDQDTTSTVIARGASRAAPVSVTWGDGSGRSSDRSSCSVVRAMNRPDSCVVTLSHRYRSVGTFPIVVRSGARVIARTTVVVREAPRPWSPPAGFVQPAGWAFFGGGATYVPCSTVQWYYDRSAEPAGAVGMRGEIEAGLARLAAETGLVFAETTDPAAARLRFDWGDLAARYAGAGEAAGVGGRRGDQGFVTFSTTHWWPTDQWPGFGVVTQPNGSYAIGRGWLVVHETMHALGMDHVEDSTQVMNPVAGLYSDLGAGDRDGLRTMYLNNPCPV